MYCGICFFGDLEAGDSRTFNIFYGSTATAFPVFLDFTGTATALLQTSIEAADSEVPVPTTFAFVLAGAVFMVVCRKRLNQHLKDNFDIVSWENIETLGTYLRSHCEKNASFSFFQATTQLLNQLYVSRIDEFKGAENMSTGQQALKTYVQVVQRVLILKQTCLFPDFITGFTLDIAVAFTETDIM